MGCHRVISLPLVSVDVNGVAVQGALSSFVDSLVIRSSLPRHQLYYPCFPSSARFPFPDASIFGDKSGFDTSRRLAASTDLCKQTSRPLRRQAASTDFTPKLRYFHENKQISPYFQPYFRVIEYYQSLFTPLLAIQLLPTRFEQLLSIFTHI